VDVFVRKLRQKLQRNSANWLYIHTHFGIGYRFDPEPVGSVAGDSVEVPMPDDATALPLTAAADAAESADEIAAVERT
jgi:hypothetical protein